MRHPEWETGFKAGHDAGEAAYAALAGELDRNAHERERICAELARVLPVVDAAREFVASDAGMRADLAAWRGLRDVLAALDGDAAATPQPAGNLTEDERWQLRNRMEQLIGWAKAGRSGSNYLMDAENVDRLRFDVIEIVESFMAARAPAPPVDVTARLRVLAAELDEIEQTAAYGTALARSAPFVHLADFVEQHPGSPSVQAIVRALATPTTEETAR